MSAQKKKSPKLLRLSLPVAGDLGGFRRILFKLAGTRIKRVQMCFGKGKRAEDVSGGSGACKSECGPHLGELGPVKRLVALEKLSGQVTVFSVKVLWRNIRDL